MQTILKDIRYRLKGLPRRPSFTLIVAATLALGIGANTVIFGVINATLLRRFLSRIPTGSSLFGKQLHK